MVSILHGTAITGRLVVNAAAANRFVHTDGLTGGFRRDSKSVLQEFPTSHALPNVGEYGPG